MGQRTHSMNSHHFHAVIWIDHHEARVFHFSPTDVERLVLHPGHPTKHIHHKQTPSGAGTNRRITPSFRLSANRSQTLARFSLRGQPMPRPSWSSTSANMT